MVPYAIPAKLSTPFEVGYIESFNPRVLSRTPQVVPFRVVAQNTPLYGPLSPKGLFKGDPKPKSAIWSPCLDVQDC